MRETFPSLYGSWKFLWKKIFDIILRVVSVQFWKVWIGSSKNQVPSDMSICLTHSVGCGDVKLCNIVKEC